MKRLPFIVSLVGLLGLAGCGKFFPPITGGCTSNCTTSTNFLYVANQATAGASVAGFSLANSALATVPNSPYALSVLPTAFAVNAANTFLYVGSSDGLIYLYAISSDGSLTIQNAGAPVASVATASMAIDSTGEWLMVANASTAAVSVFSINSTSGILTAATGGPIAVNKGVGLPVDLTITPNNAFAYVSLGVKGVEVLAFDSTSGTLTDTGGNLAPKGVANSDQALAVDPNTKYLFVTETGINALRVLAIAADGSLTQVGSPVATGLGPSAVMVDATGSYVYVANRTANNISAFLLTNAGTLTSVSGSPFTTGTNPVAIVEDSSKTYIAVVCAGGSPDLQVYTFDATTAGKLDAFATSATGTDPAIPVAVVATH